MRIGWSPLSATFTAGRANTALAATSSTMAARTSLRSGGRFIPARDLERVHQRADDARAGVRDVAHGALGVGDARLVLARDEERIAGAEGDGLRIGVLGGRRRVDQHDVVLGRRLG